MARSTTKINTLIKGISARSQKQRDDIQEALIEAAMFAFLDDRNVDPAKRLFNAVGGETHRAGMSKWLSLNAPVHFKDGIPCLSGDRQKEMNATMTPAEYEAQIRTMPAWYVMDEANNTNVNVWDTAEQIKKFDDYFLKIVQKFGKHDSTVAEALDRAHSLMRAELGRVVEVVETAQ